MKNQTIAFIGGGNMARSLIGGLIADGYDPKRIWASDPDAAQLKSLVTHFGIHTTTDNAEAVGHADAVVIAVKPQVVHRVAEPIGPIIRERGAVAISIAAGIRETDLSRWLGGEVAVVRAMPNTPALVQTGATALYANDLVSRAQRDLAESLLRAVGLTRWLEDEQMMNAVTAVSGSGPAYFFLLMELIENAGTELGLPAETARLLTLQTALGAARMALESEEDAPELRRRVTSPGGTTEAALTTLEKGGIEALMTRAIESAAQRADELGRELGAD